MPGIILVSVLEFMGLPHALASSSICIKVSMGKIEYQIWDKGDFSFPLTSLRDNLIVTLQDADGIKISHAGVEIKSIVEKGLWDDLFPLEGGGHIHMKLQFVLSEEERSRIRMMNDADRYEEISSTISAPQGVDVHLSHKELVEKNESKSLPADFPTEAISSNETSLLLGGSRLDVAASNNSIPHNLGEDSGHNIQKQSQLGKSPRNVKNMISAFESGLAQDMRSPIKSPPTRSQTKELQHTPTDIRKRGEQINLLGASDRSKLSQDTGQLEELNTKKFQILGTKSSLKNKFHVVHKEVSREEEKSHQDLMRISTSETATVSWRILDEYSDEARQLCVTTGGKKVMDLMGGCSTKPKVHQGNVNLSMQENMEKHSVDARTVIKADKDKKECQKIGKSKPENSEDIETSGGPVGQAIKVAIMLGFGILVLLTRKRNYR
nr:hypothetical protein CFP56_53080 [Quercus suber]